MIGQRRREKNSCLFIYFPPTALNPPPSGRNTFRNEGNEVKKIIIKVKRKKKKEIVRMAEERKITGQ
jgi:hypothetical protein